jgi:hypothetical protein
VEFKSDKTCRFDQAIGIDEWTPVLLGLFCTPFFEDLWLDPKIDLASIYQLFVIL